LAAKAALIVTGDHHLLALGSYQNVRVITLAELLEGLP
jgi:predicted nucleic acid-binding protein